MSTFWALGISGFTERLNSIEFARNVRMEHEQQPQKKRQLQEPLEKFNALQQFEVDRVTSQRACHCLCSLALVTVAGHRQRSKKIPIQDSARILAPANRDSATRMLAVVSRAEGKQWWQQVVYMRQDVENGPPDVFSRIGQNTSSKQNAERAICPPCGSSAATELQKAREHGIKFRTASFEMMRQENGTQLLVSLAALRARTRERSEDELVC